MNETRSTELVRAPGQNAAVAPASEYDGMRFTMSPAESLRRLTELRAFVKTVMKPGINADYAIIPGTQKATLLQPGAQKLCEIYGLAVSFHDVETVKDWDKQFFFFEKRCVLTSRRDGRFICDGVGSCNSKEDRYAGRWVNDGEVPAGLDKENLKRKERQTQRGLWVQYRVPNDDLCSLVNTFQKMACKRALIHAVLNATRSADIFTQDLEHIEIDEAAVGQADETRSWQKQDDDQRSVAEKVQEFEAEIRGARTEAEFNVIAAEISKSDLPMSAGTPLRKLWGDCKAEMLKGGAKPAAAPTEEKAAPKTVKAKAAPKSEPTCDGRHAEPACADQRCWLTSDREPGQD